MAEKNIEALRKSALDSVTNQSAGKKAEIVLEDTDTVPSSKATVHRFVVRPAGEPNGPHTTVVVDAGGKSVDLAKLSVAEGKTFFAAPELKVDVPAALVARRVTINPKVNDIQLTECGFRETITVTIPAQPIAQKVDVYFLADNTFSMSTAIASVRAGASMILTTLAGIVPDIQFGVGNYHDFTDPNHFQNQLAINANHAAVTAAINSWVASGGGDQPEAALFALHEVASVAGWRPGSLKFIVWFGDAPSHEPICGPIWGGGFNITRATVIADLQGQKVAVLAVSVNSGFGSTGLDGASTGGYTNCLSNGLTGQATDITNATGGSLTAGVNPSAVANAILNALLGDSQRQPGPHRRHRPVRHLDHACRRLRSAGPDQAAHADIRSRFRAQFRDLLVARPGLHGLDRRRGGPRRHREEAHQDHHSQVPLSLRRKVRLRRQRGSGRALQPGPSWPLLDGDQHLQRLLLRGVDRKARHAGGLER